MFYTGFSFFTYSNGKYPLDWRKRHESKETVKGKWGKAEHRISK
jgi:hypothetical protein